MTQAFLYKWTHKPTNKWYIGSRTAKNCHINDGYICSSKIVKPMILETKQEWNREILCIGMPKYIRDLEAELLDVLDAKADINSFNQHNGDGKFTTAGTIRTRESRQKQSNAMSGRSLSENHKKKIGKIHKGKFVSAETRKLIGAKSKGRMQSAEARLKNSIKNFGSNNGNAKKITIGNMTYNCMKEAVIETGLSMYKLRKLKKEI